MKSSLTSFFSAALSAGLLFAAGLPAAAQAPAWQSARAVAAASVSAATDGSRVLATASDAAGNVYVAGYFKNTVVLGTTTLTSAEAENAFVAKFNPLTNQFEWAQRAGGVGLDEVTALTVSGTSVYVAGNFNSPLMSFGPATLTRSGDSDVFVAKLTDAGSTGSFVWAQKAGGTFADGTNALAVSGSNVYVAGYTASSIATFGTTTLAVIGGADAFVAKLTDAGSTGSFAWAQRAGGNGDDRVNTLTLSGTSVYAGGYYFSASVPFGSATLTNSTPNNPVGFLAAPTDPNITATAAGRTLAPAQLFPNPARRMAILRLPAGTAPAPLILVDAQGRTVRRYPAPARPEAALDLDGLPAGLYQLQGIGPAVRLAVE